MTGKSPLLADYAQNIWILTGQYSQHDKIGIIKQSVTY